MQEWSELIFSSDIPFEEKAKKVFHYQFDNNPVYRRFCEALGIEKIDKPEKASLLPIQAFKHKKIVTAVNNSKFKIQNLKFKSSGTSSMQQSTHRVLDPSIYDHSLIQGFKNFYDLDSSAIWGYTPGYSENPHSSLIYMIQKLIEQDASGLSRFLSLNKPLKKEAVDEVKDSGKRLILFGAAFGLIDLTERSSVKLPSESIVIETGGMKTHRREITRDELHQKLAEGFGLDSSRIHSEYGMAESLSQAYATGSKWFRSPPWMKVSIRNPKNSFETLPAFKEGLIGIIDLANVHSCSFLLTGDCGMMDRKGRFQVMRRWNPKDLRGCNFLIDED